MLLFADYTAQEYFEVNGATLFPAAEADITRICLTYLSFNAFGENGCAHMKLFDDYDPYEYPLFNYAAVHWGHHARRNEESTSDIIQDFLSHKPNVVCATAVLLQHNNKGYYQPCRTDFGEIHLLSFFGLEKTISELLKSRHLADSRDSWGQTPLLHAAVQGHVEIVRLLLARDDVDMNSEDKDGRSPLWYGIDKGHLEVVRLFFAQGDVDVHSRDKDGRSLLSYAAESKNSNIVAQFLAQGDIDVNSKDKDGRSPLSYATQYWNSETVQLFLG